MATLASQWIQKGVEQGAQQILQQWTEQILRALERKLGTLRPTVKQRIYALPVSQVEQLTDAMLDFKKKTDLTKWLDDYEHPAETEPTVLN